MDLREAYALLGGDLMETLARLGSEALLVKYLRQFPQDDAMPALRAAVEAGDEAAVWQAAHQLRGVCRTLGLESLAEAAGQCMAAPEAARETVEREYARTVAVIGLLSNAVEQETERVESPRTFDGLRALLAEDDRLCAETSAELLAGLGLRVHVAYSGDEAVRLARLGGFDCVFLDAHMPGSDGVSTVNDIRRALPEAPIIGLTAGLRPDEEERLRAAGTRAILRKPADEAQISRLLSAWFAEK